MFFIEIMSTVNAIKCFLKESYDKQNLTVVVMSYEIYEMSLAKGLFHKFYMK